MFFLVRVGVSMCVKWTYSYVVMFITNLSLSRDLRLVTVGDQYSEYPTLPYPQGLLERQLVRDKHVHII